MIVGRISIMRIVLFFVMYLIIHIIIGVITNNIKKQLDAKPSNEELEYKYKWLNRVFKCFPAIYVVFLLFAL